MLKTNLKHLETAEQHKEAIESNENVMVCCGRMGPMCIPVFQAMEQLEKDYDNVAFRDMFFDLPDAAVIRNLPECARFMGLPFTIYYKNGKVVKATSGLQSKDQVKAILDTEFK